MHMLPGPFFPLVMVLSIFGPIFLFRAFIRPSERIRAVPIVWRALPLVIMVAGLSAGLLSSVYPRAWDVAIALGTLLLSSLAAMWGWRVERELVGPDRTRDAIRLFGDD